MGKHHKADKKDKVAKKERKAAKASAPAPTPDLASARVSTPAVDPDAVWRTPEELAAERGADSGAGVDEEVRPPAETRGLADPSSSPTPVELSDDVLDRLRSGTHHDPHSVYGAHRAGDGSVVRTMQPGNSPKQLKQFFLRILPSFVASRNYCN